MFGVSTTRSVGRESGSGACDDQDQGGRSRRRWRLGL